jgi:hypothetical protein
MLSKINKVDLGKFIIDNGVNSPTVHNHLKDLALNQYEVELSYHIFEPLMNDFISMYDKLVYMCVVAYVNSCQPNSQQ